MADTTHNIDNTTAEQALAFVIADWNEGGVTWNPDRLTSVYTEDALMFAGRPGHAVGREAIRAYFVTYEGVIASAIMNFVEPQFLPLAPDCFLVQGFADFKFRLAGGEDTRSVLRATLVIAREGGSWRIRQHHFSATPDKPPIR